MILLGPELVTNGGFEDDPVDPSSWVKDSNQSSMSVSSAGYSYEGTNHLVFEVYSSGGGSWLTTFSQTSMTSWVTSGEVYRLDVAVSANSIQIWDLRVYGNDFYDPSLNAGGYTEYTSIQSWTFYSWDFESMDTMHPKIKTRLPKATTGSYVVCWDSITLKRMVNIPVDYGYEKVKTLDRILTRGAKGDLRVYAGPGNYRRFNAPVSWVTALDASAINSWWVTGTDINLIENNDYPNSYYSVRIIGEKQPINQYQRPYYDEYLTGELIMETV